jgi:HTH-type transcriptional regulator / antitoxin HigA
MEIHPIRNDGDHAAALREIERLEDAAAGTEEGDKLDILAMLFENMRIAAGRISTPLIRSTS